MQPPPKHFRERNRVHYRLAHWPIWIFVFFLAPGPLIFDVIEKGFDRRSAIWLGLVLLGTGFAGLRGRLPGVEPKPYILHFTEDKPNPLYRRVCYTAAWGDLLTFAILNLAGLSYAVVSGVWRLKQIYQNAYFPLAILIWILGAAGKLPRVRSSTKGEGTERRYFYGTVWAVSAAEPVLGLLWKTLPRSHEADVAKLIVYVAILTGMGLLAKRGVLPRTRVIQPGEWAVSD
ncbi:MAG TPA: hypothetical protein VMT15_04160 [Bryobacteraceae bacterium]|nr:hypothetical protein [Bryobacteraceae bacterium]